jgi:hypothetical protein
MELFALIVIVRRIFSSVFLRFSTREFICVLNLPGRIVLARMFLGFVMPLFVQTYYIIHHLQLKKSLPTKLMD